VIVLVRGGGSADDLAAYNDEPLVRAIAGSRVPTLVGVGHEQDESLADLVADLRASTPSNAAQLLVPDRREIRQAVRASVSGVLPHVQHAIEYQRQQVRSSLQNALDEVRLRIDEKLRVVGSAKELLAAYDPRAVLQRGYALVRGEQREGGMIRVETKAAILTAKVEKYEQK